MPHFLTADDPRVREASAERGSVVKRFDTVACVTRTRGEAVMCSFPNVTDEEGRPVPGGASYRAHPADLHIPVRDARSGTELGAVDIHIDDACMGTIFFRSDKLQEDTEALVNWAGVEQQLQPILAK